MAASKQERDGGGAAVSWPRRLGWLLLLWAMSVAALGVAAWGLKAVMRWVGMAA